jgi:hypothetical protein
VVSWLCSWWHLARIRLGSQTHSTPLPRPPHLLLIHHWRSLEDVCRQPDWRLIKPRVWRCGSHVPLPGLLLNWLDTTAYPVPARGSELLYSCQWSGWRIILIECPGVSTNFYHTGALLTDFRRLVFVFIMPIGLNNIGWKMYMVNASWDIVILGLIVSLLPMFPPFIANKIRHIIGLKPRGRRSKKLMHCLKARSTPMCLMWSWCARARTKLTSRFLSSNLMLKLWVRRLSRRI